ncbi:hypothetical protein GGS20DRAFT_243554 [Poronia punctata]|nr:hypothetical protein GGS20DRAFT_243554 [Poronia punctata]
MEPPSKRLKLDSPLYSDDEEEQDELSLTPGQFDAIQDPLYQLDKKRAKSATRLKSAYESIFEKYGKEFDGSDDLVNLYTGEIEVDNGHLKSLEDAEEDSHSSGGEESISKETPAGSKEKPARARVKPRSKSLTAANPNQYNRMPQFQAPWNPAPSLGAFQLPSAYSFPPFDANPPFDFGYSSFGNAQVDPLWQAPDLPPQPPPYQQGSHFGSERMQHGPRRLVDAKSFLGDVSKPGTDGDNSEEDELLTASNDLATSSRSLPNCAQTLSAADNTATEATEVMGREAPPQEGDVVTEDVEDNQATEDSHKPCAPTKGRGRPRKSNTRSLTASPNSKARSEPRALRAHEKRIEVIIPMIKRILSNATADGIENETLVSTEEELSNMHTGTVVNSSLDQDEVLHLPFRHLEETGGVDQTEPPQDPGGASGLRKPRKRRRSSPREQMDSTSESMLPELIQETQTSPIGGHEDIGQDPSDPLQTSTGNSKDDLTTENLNSSEQEPDGINGINESSYSFSNQQYPMLEAIEPDEDSIPNFEPTMGSPLMSTFEDGLLPPLPLTGTSEDQFAEMTGSHDPGSPSALLESFLGKGATTSSVGFRGRVPLSSDAPTYTFSDIQLEEVFRDLEAMDIPQSDITPGTPGPPPVIDTIEPSSSPYQDCLPTIEKFETPEVQMIEEAENAPPTSAPVSELDQLNLGSDPGHFERSPSLGAKGSRARDYSVPEDEPEVLPDHVSTLRSPTPPTARNEKGPNTSNGRSPSPELGTPTRSDAKPSNAPKKPAQTPETPTKTRTPKSGKSRITHRRTSSSKPISLTSLLPSGIDDESEDELSFVTSVRRTTPRFFSPSSRTGTPSLPPLQAGSHKKTRKSGLSIRTPSSSTRAPRRISGLSGSRNLPPATETRAGRIQARTPRGRPAHSSPLARRVASRLLSSPTRKQSLLPLRDPDLVATPGGTLRRCGENGFSCGREFCFTCCI